MCVCRDRVLLEYDNDEINIALVVIVIICIVLFIVFIGVLVSVISALCFIAFTCHFTLGNESDCCFVVKD